MILHGLLHDGNQAGLDSGTGDLLVKICNVPPPPCRSRLRQLLPPLNPPPSNPPPFRLPLPPHSAPLPLVH